MILAATAWLSQRAAAQEFFNLTAEQVKIDTLLPRFACSRVIGTDYADSAYAVAIEYPEFVDMTEADVRRYKAITDEPLPEMPEIEQGFSVERKVGSLCVSFVPLVFRDGKYQKLVSFKLNITSRPVSAGARRASAATRSTASSGRYAAHSVLADGTWAKIRVPATGIYQITDELARRAGFSSAATVRIYGYGGELQPETLSGDYLATTDDLQEVPSCTVGGRRLFYARGPVSWNTANNRVRNPYSDYGYYFLIESEGEPLATDSATFVGSFYPSGEHYNTLHEVDDYAWFAGGRNLFESTQLTETSPGAYTIASAGPSAGGQVRVVVTAGTASTVSVSVNDSVVGTMSVSQPGDYDEALSTSSTFYVSNLAASNTVTVTPTAGGPVRLDYIAIHTDEPAQAPRLSSDTYPAPEYVYRITNQDLHADGPADMVIIIPTSQTLRPQAERLAALHEQHDSMRVRIVPADELFNEFSSGTPDATAYRRYMKMLYDRAETEADMPKHLILFGDGAWDNRMRTSDWRNYSPDDYLLCFESQNSFNEIHCYVTDDFYCLLDDGEAIQTGNSSSGFLGQPDVAVGRLPVRTLSEAEDVVDKIEAYMTNANAGPWQNTIVVMGDDGDNNTHMDTANEVAEQVKSQHPGYSVKKVMWDAYQREASATGNSYPDVTRLLKQYMTDGTLVMNYNGHGVEYCLSHEQVLVLNDFRTAVSPNLPLWVTAACDILPFDGQEENIGEVALLNPNGGAVAFYGTTRTVYSSYNERMNLAFMREVLSTDDNGERVRMGEAVRRAKVYLVTNGGDRTDNKLQFTFLGDPALRLATPTMQAVVDSINGVAVANDGTADVTLAAASSVVVKGRILKNGTTSTDFNGTVTATVSDAAQQVVCRLNDTSADAPSSAFVFTDRSSVVFKGSDNVSAGEFTFSFAVPKDISYSDGAGMINLYAVSDDRTQTANGADSSFVLNGSASLRPDSVGPAIYCYLNSSSFVNGGNVNSTPYFFAELSDESGLNAAGTGVGHDIQLVIDGEMSKTYTLNDYFTFDFGSYQSGTVGFSLPQLEEGPHRLRFRAWDILNNSSTTELAFNVVSGLEPGIIDVDCTENPATTATTFRIIHDRIGTQMDVVLDLFDMSGRHLWTHSETDVPTDNTLDIDWDLTIDGGRRLGTGVYIYRVRASSEGSSYASKAKKLIIISNK